jgi:hypothetical protein
MDDRAVRGTIRRRVLVNAVVDPDEAATRLPDGLRPHVTAEGTVVGCCLLEIEGVRPAWAPSVVGRSLRAAAHRISSEWEDPSGETITGVFVPVRHTDSWLAVAAGGRWFPGVHARAHLEVAAARARLRWVSDPVRDASDLGIRTVVSIPDGDRAGAVCDPVGGTCLAATVGVSPDHRGVLEAVRMDPSHRDACEIGVEELDSAFIDGFATAKLVASYVMRDAEVTWRPASPPYTGAKVRSNG